MRPEVGPEQGFSLLELVCVLALVGLLAVVATIGLSRSVSQYALTRDSDALAQKAQIALRRIVIELSHLDVDANTPVAFAPTDQTYSYPTVFPDGAHGDTMTYQPATGLLAWNGFPLCDHVTGFTMESQPAVATGKTLASVAITLTVTGESGASRTFSTTFAVKGRFAQ